MLLFSAVDLPLVALGALLLGSPDNRADYQNATAIPRDNHDAAQEI
jgi:hypothetical protein